MNSDETCSMCGVPIYDVSVFRESTLCSGCRRRQAAEDSAPLQMPAPVPGTWYEPLPDGFRLGASTRSGKGYFLIAFMVIFLGIMIRSGVSREPFTVLIVSWFALAALWQCAMGLFGTVRLTRDGSAFTVFSGIGPLGRRRVYDWGDRTSVHERALPSGEGSAEQEIILVGGRRVAFGLALSDERRYFLREILRIELKRGRA